MTDKFKDTEFKAKAYSCSKCDYVSLLVRPVSKHIASKCIGATIATSHKIVQHFTKGYVEGKLITLYQCSLCPYTSPLVGSLKNHQLKCEGSMKISAKRVLIFKEDDTNTKIDIPRLFSRPKVDTQILDRPVVYMRVHRDTGYYYIGSTRKAVITRHGQDVHYASKGEHLNSNIIALIWGILLREGDPYEEFDFITLGDYGTRKEAYDAERHLTNEYYNGRGDRDKSLLLNNYTSTTIVSPIYNQKGLIGYRVRGGPNKVHTTFMNRKNYSLEQLKEFADEFAITNKISPSYRQTDI